LLDTHLQAVELLRDRSHVRDWRVSDWQRMLAAAGFESEVVMQWSLHLEFKSWVTRLATPENRIAAIRVMLDEAPDEVKTFFRVQGDHSFDIPGALLRARKRQ
jgi:hypothetical protein